GGGAGGGRRGAGDAPGGGGRGWPPGVRADRVGTAEGLRHGDRAVPRPAGRGLAGPLYTRDVEPDALLEAVRAGGLLPAGEPVVALISGGRDSVCLLDVAMRLAGAPAVVALHVNYGLRPEA